MKMIKKIFMLMLLSCIQGIVFAKPNPADCFTNAPWHLSEDRAVALCAGSYNDPQAPLDCYQRAPWHLSEDYKIALCAQNPLIATKLLMGK